ncbi:hypothetical protein AJ79_09162 [Helicocarpus griseus UAMH5409]|uniref:Ig-like domain-containing protein n=1 Tax=Helicocarpus griseus UAMH5409 TaxID=1447875 RepID=A0A2B7WM19_9EURO|nr:hypothetical protein AJ79_09162 [Helicocarpus griseus UAMH5409]
MWKHLPLLLSVASSALASPSLVRRQENATTIPSVVERGINTECKKCPFSLCPNVEAYGGGDNVTLECWASGTNVNGDVTWLRTTTGCYITQWDLIEYQGDYTQALPHCGDIAEVYKKTHGKTKYYTECNIYPAIRGDHIKMYKYGIDLVLTCYTDDAEPWYKTTSNCYVSSTLLELVQGKDEIEPCGPVPFMEKKMREPDPEPEVQAKAPSFPKSDPAPTSHLARRFLYDTAVGEDEAHCYQENNNSSAIVKTYVWDEKVTPQCGTYLEGADRRTENIMLFTIDFCYVMDKLLDPNLVDSVVRSQYFPHCEDFVDEK